MTKKLILYAVVLVGTAADIHAGGGKQGWSGMEKNGMKCNSQRVQVEILDVFRDEDWMLDICMVQDTLH